MSEKRIPFNVIVKNQAPFYVEEQSPLSLEFLSEYYKSQEYHGGSIDIIENLTNYTKLETLTQYVESTTLDSDISFADTEITVNNTDGFPESYGLIKIGDELITYTSKTSVQFLGCLRGFSGITSFRNPSIPEELIFSSSFALDHQEGDAVYNLSSLLLKEFFNKIKKQIAPGFSGREFYSDINQETFVHQLKNFYSSKGTDSAFKILFKGLYNEEVEVLKPRENLIRPSGASYEKTRDVVIESISGNPLDLINQTLYQDEYKNISRAYAPVGKVEKITTGVSTSNYYRLGFDANYNRDINVSGSLYGEFSVHPYSRVIGNTFAGATTIDVDSTVSFPNDGELSVIYVDGTVGIVSYTSKSLNQFYGCSSITKTIKDASPIRLNTYAYGYSQNDSNEIISVRITSVLENFNIPENTRNLSKGDTALIETLGKNDKKRIATNWMYNICPTYDINKIGLIDASNNSYSIEFVDTHTFIIGDQITLKSTDDSESIATVDGILSDISIAIKGQGSLSLSKKYKATRNLSKVNSSFFPTVSNINTNVQNVYQDGDKLLVSSPSIPNYYNQSLDITDNAITFSGSFSGSIFNISPNSDHGFYTGDAVYYTPEKITVQVPDENGIEQTRTRILSSLGINIPEGLYFIRRVDENNIQLAKSRSSLFNAQYLSVDVAGGENNPSVIVQNNKIEPYITRGKILASQNLLREIAPPIYDGLLHKTESGKIGILVNGVEILNYKSKDNLYYGGLEDIIVTKGGKNYDIINPPFLRISDIVGTGATGSCTVNGGLKEIRLVDPGFDYLEKPIIRITGGNGSGAQADVNLKSVEHKISFNANASAQQVGLGATNSVIGFGTYHKFRNAEQVIYKTDKQPNIVGLVTDAVYYLGVIDEYRVRLHSTKNDAVLGINTITFSNYGSGNHSFQSLKNKLVIDSVIVTNSGSGYENKYRTASAVTGIITASNLIVIKNHNYKSGEIVKYTVDGSPISGLTTNTEYYVTTVNDDSFRLSKVGISTGTKDYFYRKKIFLELDSTGSGTHIFNYPEILVEVIGAVGVSSVAQENFKAKVQPIFRGEITSVYLTSTGSGYGSEEVLNFNRLPEISLLTGSGAQLTPIVSLEGKIVDVLVNQSGSFYHAPPNLQIIGSGKGAVLTPIVQNGQIKSIKIINEGSGYISGQTFINVIVPGMEAEFLPKIKSWVVNLHKKYQTRVPADDGITVEGLNENYGLQYAHLYAPRKLREMVYVIDQSGKVLYGKPDLVKSGSLEVNSINHSPIIGWAYDGHPIYGPYGYVTKLGGSVIQMRSGYKIQLANGRPSLTKFPAGFFVEDYVYETSGEDFILDENNGRYCVTPEFPNGTYAYFATLSITPDTGGVFNGYKSPVFPYLIGNSFKALPNKFNFQKTSNQNDYNIKNSNWIRNTSLYNLRAKAGSYSYVSLPNQLNQKTTVKYASSGSIEKVGIVTGGSNYKVGDKIVFLESHTGGYGADFRVSRLGGKDVSSISVASSAISNVEFYPYSGKGSFIAFAPSPHNYLNSDIISVAGLNTTSSKLEGSYLSGINTDRIYELTFDVGTVSQTGIITYITVNGNLNYPELRENDILGIGTIGEQVKILNIDSKSSRIRVLRQVNGVSAAHTATTKAYEIQRKLFINVGYNTDFNYTVNREIYFNPLETLGIGTVSGVGIGTTLSISNPGAGATQIFVPIQSIYLPNHQLNTGDLVVYNLNGGNSIGITTNQQISNARTLADQSILFISKITDDLVGISTVKLGIGTSGTFVGIASTTKNDTLLWFTGQGTGAHHSFKTIYPNVIKGTIERNLVTVSTAQTHQLRNYDEVFIDVRPSISTTFTLKYNDYNRRVVVNPTNFTAAGINTQTSEITINNHGFYHGQKLIHTCTGTSYGLLNNEIYYVIYVDKNTFKLSNSYEESISLFPTPVGIPTAFNGTLSQINPKINAYKNTTLIFDLSDSSFAVSYQSQSYPVFDFNLYIDSNFTTKFESTQNTSQFEVRKYGIVGVTTDARVEIAVIDEFPKTLYYKLDPINYTISPKEKREIIVDDLVTSYNQVSFDRSSYDGKYKVITTSPSSFTYTLSKSPESTSYTSSSSKLNYETTSPTASGSIAKISVKNPGNNYRSLPGISTSLITTNGTGAILEAYSDSIGNLKTSTLDDIGYDFPADTTLRPTAKLPLLCKITSSATLIENIGVTSAGKGYSASPRLVVLDGKTKKLVPEIDLEYTIGAGKVKILKNSNGLSNTPPRIVPIQNSNGIGISTITYNSVSKTAAITLKVGFTTAESFPFAINDKVFIENVGVGIGSTGKGYNFENYGYDFFQIISVAENRGGIGIVTISMGNLLKDGEVPGKFDPFNSSGKLVAEKNLPQFSVSIKPTDFVNGERIFSIDSKEMRGNVQYWDNQTGILKINTLDEIYPGMKVKGDVSSAIATVDSVTVFDSSYKTNYFSIVERGWENNIGFLNEIFQRMSDNDYYQNFSYSLKSRVDFDKWEDIVSTLNHTSGFKKFSDLQIESLLPDYNDDAAIVKIPNNAPDVEIVVNVDSSFDINCYPDYDIVTENAIRFGNNFISDEIIFKTKILTDYSESIGNRVLILDDISDEFNSNPRTTRCIEVARFLIADVLSKKVIILVQNKRYTYQRQILTLTLMRDRIDNFLSSYARVESSYDMGTFDFAIDGSEGVILFCPKYYVYDDYDVTCLFFNINSGTLGIGSTSFGDIANVSSNLNSAGIGASCNIVSLDATNSSVKTIVDIKGNNGEHLFAEFSAVRSRDGEQIDFLEYGSLYNDNSSFYSSGSIGTFHPYITPASELKVDFIPYSGIAVTATSLNISIGNSTKSGVGTYLLQYGRLSSQLASIGATSFPTPLEICQYSNQFGGGYALAQVTNTDTGDVRLSELSFVVTSSPENQAYFTEYGETFTTSIGIVTTVAGVTGFGTFNVGIGSTTNNTIISFTPESNVGVEVRLFTALTKYEETAPLEFLIGLQNASLETRYGLARAATFDVKRSFNLTHKDLLVFDQRFIATDTYVNFNNGIISLPNHFFVTGEEVTYTNPGAGTSLAVGIGTTTITGIGITDKLPSTVYVVKLNETDIKVAETAAKALSDPPITLDLVSPGIGTEYHIFSSTKANQRVIISLDNIIQSPIVATALTSSLTRYLFTSDDNVFLETTDQFFGGDLVKIDDEIMRVVAVGIASTSALLVQRAWLGTRLVGHSTNAIARKVTGNFNIIGNTLTFVDAPYGNVPLGTSTNSPNERDWIGITTRSKFHGRSFLRSAVPNSSADAYSKNYVFDSLSDQFDGVSKTFTLKSNASNVAGFSTENAIVLRKNIFQGPSLSYDYTLSESSGITSITFVGSASSSFLDPNVGTLPLGGVIVTVGSTEGLGYQPLVSAGGTAIVSVAGTIQSISIGNSGSGYRTGIKTTFGVQSTIVRVGVATSSVIGTNIFYVGIATIVDGHVTGVAITNPGIGYTSSNPPRVVFDTPLSYSNLPLIYSSKSPRLSGGQAATANIVVGQGSSIIDFQLTNLGYGYRSGDVLTVSIGGTIGIPTTSSTFKEFNIVVDTVYNDTFSAWSLGQMQVLDDFSAEFDGEKRQFKLRLNGQILSLKAPKGSLIDIEATLLIFVNDILQIPKESYLFEGGTNIVFTEAPKAGDTLKVLFYKGSVDIDVRDVDIIENVKTGDELTIGYDSYSGQSNEVQEDYRSVVDVTSINSVDTNVYYGPGNSSDPTLIRPVFWCKQTEDKIINQKEIAKDRNLYEPLIFPATNVIQTVSTGTTVIYVESVKSFFDPFNEDKNSLTFQNSVILTSQDLKVGASATAVVSIAGTISSIVISDGGVGYGTTAVVRIANPLGFGVSNPATSYNLGSETFVGLGTTATATAQITAGIITAIQITNPGTGYTFSNPPSVVIEHPKLNRKVLSSISYQGDFGIIVGLTTTSVVGVASTALKLDFYIPPTSVLHDTAIVGTAITISGISTGDYFVLSDSNVNLGIGTTTQSTLLSIRSNGSTIGVGTTFIDNVYQVVSTAVTSKYNVQFGQIYVKEVTVAINNSKDYISPTFDSTSITFDSTSVTFSFARDFDRTIGNFSWGKIPISSITTSEPFYFYNQNGITGIQTSALIVRQRSLKYKNYKT